MKTKKTIIIAAIAVSVISLCTIVACSKEKGNTNTENNNLVTKYKPNDTKKLTGYINLFWQYCRNAYKNYPDSFLSICDNEEMSDFLSITQMPNTLIDSIYVVTNRLIDNPNGNPKPTSPYDTCSTCHASLSEVGSMIVDMSRLVDSIALYDVDFDDDYPCTLTPEEGCYYHCRITSSNAAFAACIFMCFADLNHIILESQLQSLIETLGEH
jgi:hypothetical protein